MFEKLKDIRDFSTKIVKFSLPLPNPEHFYVDQESYIYHYERHTHW